MYLDIPKIGQFPDESVRIKDEQIHYVTSQTYCQSCGWMKFQIEPLGDHLCTCTTYSSVKKTHDWVVDQLPDRFHTTHNIKTQQVVTLNEVVVDQIRKYLTDYNNNFPNSGIWAPMVMTRVQSLGFRVLDFGFSPIYIKVNTYNCILRESQTNPANRIHPENNKDFGVIHISS
jgi:hypothetical protein